MGMVVTVAGAVGGIGTSTFAYAVALQVGSALQVGHKPVLIDAQPDGVPLDLVVGAEQVPGIRWSQVRIRSADISADTILSALPTHRGVAVLSADREATADAVALGHVVQVLRDEQCVVILDIPARHPLRASLRPEVDVLLLPPTLGGIVAAHAALREGTQLVLVDIGRADVTAPMVGEYLAYSPVGVVRWQRSVTAWAAAGGNLSRSSDVMRVAARIMGVDGGLRTA